MSGYLAIFAIRMRALLKYRMAAFSGACTQLFWGIVMVMIYEAFYQQGSSNTALSIGNTLTFMWLGQAFLQLLPAWVDKEIEMQIRNGNVSYELLRPLNLYGVWIARALAMKAVPSFMRSVPIFLVGGFFGLTLPVSWQAGAAFGIALLLGLLLSAVITASILITFFWTIAGEGIQRMMVYLSFFLSGMIVPLPLFPDWMQPFIQVQPLRGILDIPIRLYTGVIELQDLPYYLGFQMVWILFFIGLGRFLLRTAMKRFVIQGG